MDMMRRADELARATRRRTPPNPWVGAVVVNEEGVIVGEGATEQPGGRHAEIVALEQAGESARGATLYVTLEPCCHQGRTGPCTEAVIAAGVRAVVVGVLDPDERVSGHGIEALRHAGIEVTICDDALVRESLAPYLHHRRTGLPFVVAKVAATLDGAIAMEDGSSQWITSSEARSDGHELRADSQAVIVGAGTVRADDPTLTARLRDGVVEPRRIVLGDIPAGAAVLPAESFSGDVRELLARLGSEDVLQVLIEGGPRVIGPALAQGLVNRVVWYAAPAFAGLETSRPALASLRTSTLEQLRRGRIVSVRTVGDDVRIEVEMTNAQHD